MNTQEVFAQQEAEELLTKDESELTDLLAARVNALQQNVGLSPQQDIAVGDEALEVTLPPWIKNTVDAMIATAIKQSHMVLCSDMPDYTDLRANLVGALGMGGSVAVIALASFLTGTLGIAAALATVLATIVIKKIGAPAIQAGHDALCAELAKLQPL